MPIYEFACRSCAGRVERRLTEPAPSVPCPQCAGRAERVWGLSPVIFRPEGWNLHPDDPSYSRLPIKEERPRWMT